MSWTVARPRIDGKVLLRESESELGSVDQVTFSAVDRPTTMSPLPDGLEERLPGTRGDFQVNGEVTPQLRDAFARGEALLLRLEAGGTVVDVDVERDGSPKAVLLHESGIIGTSFPFVVTGPVQVKAS